MTGNRRTVTYDGVEYRPGRRFRVVAEATLDGLVHSPDHRSAWDGWRQQLKPGDILTCTGFGAGWDSDPGFGVEFTSAQSEEAGAVHCDVNPMICVPFGYRPRPGILEPADS
jgi:hypothetical protein